MTLTKRNWWKVLLSLMVVGVAGVVFMGARTYQDAPPIPDFVTASGDVVISKDQILDGQLVFQKYALMDYGSFFGDGAERGPDYTADALHRTAEAMRELYGSGMARMDDASGSGARAASDAVDARVKREIKENRHDAKTNRTTLSPGQVRAVEALTAHYTDVYVGRGDHAFHPAGYITDAQELKDLSAFYFWGGWVCGVERPGKDYSYTHNWPYDPSAGNLPSPAVTLWSVFGVLGVIAGLGGVLYLRGRFEKSSGVEGPDRSRPVATERVVAAYAPTAVERATYKYFWVAAALFLLQVLAGVLTIHDFVGLTTFFGTDISESIPITVSRGWHLQLALLWITACWMGSSIFVLSRMSRPEPPGQRRLVNWLFGILVALTLGMFAGVLLGPKGLLGGMWRWFGNQGWEFVELGRAWQVLLMVAFILWAVIVWRGLRPALRGKDPWSLPHWMLYTVVAIVMLFGSAFVAGPRTNFVIADFWRWCVIHMWAEAFFEVFTTVLVGWFLFTMGLVSHHTAVRVVYLSTLLFLGSGILGISHNFYWNAKPVETLALGSVFSTLQVVPLILLTLEAWRYRRMPALAMSNGGGPGGAKALFGHSEAFLFLLAVNFWNFVGAGVFGLIINLPIVNYYEHGTYLTVNHGHAALMGVYGNLAIAALLFCARHLIVPGRWNASLLRTSFWSLNLGLGLMVVLDLFPAGVLQLQETMERGLWWSRSLEFVEGTAFQTMAWLRAVGGYLFTFGGVVPLVVFLVTRRGSLRPARESPEAPEALGDAGPDPARPGAEFPLPVDS